MRDLCTIGITAKNGLNSPSFPKNAANSRAISFIFRENLNNYAHFYLVILSCKGLYEYKFQPLFLSIIEGH